MQILGRQNCSATWRHQQYELTSTGLIDESEEGLVLVINFKTNGEELWALVNSSLDPLRRLDCLTFFNGTDVIKRPVTITVTGNAPYHKVVENAHYRDMFYDAPLELMAALVQDRSTGDRSRLVIDHINQRYTVGTLTRPPSTPQNPSVFSPANSYYATASFSSTIGSPFPFLSVSQRRKIHQQITGAHMRGLKVRYTDTAFWPMGLRNMIWQVLGDEGVDYLDIDDPLAALRWAQDSKGN